MIIRRIFQLLLVTSFAAIAVIHGAEITIVADSYMPYTGDSSKGETGFMVDIAKAILEKKGYTVTYETKPWKEALESANRGDATAIVGANRDDVPGFLLPKVPEGQAQGSFYTLASSSWKYTGPESLAKICTGVISDYKYNPEIAEFIKQNRSDTKHIQALESSPDILSKFFDHLVKKQIDTFIEDKAVVQYFLKSYDQADKFTEAGTLKSATPLYVAVSPSAIDGATIAQQLADGMAEIRSNGTLKTILSKYGVTDWGQ